MRSLNRSDAPASVLYVAPEGAEHDANRKMLEISVAECAGDGHVFNLAPDFDAACALLKEESFDLVIFDLCACGAEVETSVNKLARRARGALIIALSESMAVSDAMAALRAGAHDYVAKPLNSAALVARLKELTERHGRPGAVRLRLADGQTDSGFLGFVGSSPQMRVVVEQITRIAASDAPAFITGECGTGKNLCAKALHATGPRSDKPLIAINCGAIPRDMMEAELFGVVKGAYSGAAHDQAGAAELADGGSLLLEEIDALDLSLQTRLMRLLQTGTITRNGDGVARPVNVRIIATTRANPMQLMASRTLREDLFYRLHVLPIHMPPLRQRPADIAPLAQHFLDVASMAMAKRFDGFSPDAMSFLSAHDFPGNVRQLQNLIKRVCVLNDGGAITAPMLLAADTESAGANTAPSTTKDGFAIMPMWRQEQKIIEDTISHFSGNISQAAAALEISPSTIYRKRAGWAEMEAGQAEVA